MNAEGSRQDLNLYKDDNDDKSKIRKMESEEKAMIMYNPLNMDSTFRFIGESDNKSTDKWKRIKILINVITTINYIRKEINTFGTVPKSITQIETESNDLTNCNKTLSFNTSKKTIRDVDEYIKNKYQSRKKLIPCYILYPEEESKFIKYWNTCDS